VEALEKKILQAKQAVVRFNGIDAGRLEMIASDEYSFQYFEAYGSSTQVAISLTMPIREKSYICDTIHPFFDNLLFEGEQLRLAEKKYGLRRQSQVDRFKLLMLSGQSVISPVQIVPIVDGKAIEVTPSSQQLPRGVATKIYSLIPACANHCPICLEYSGDGEHPRCAKALWGSKKSIAIEAFEKDPINIFRTITIGQSISGAQRKALFHLDRRGVLAKAGTPTHILKPNGEFPEMPANEHLSMSIAASIGIKIPAIGLYQTEEMGLIFVTRRFDITQKNLSQPLEDMAQLAEEMAADKDQASMKDLVDLIRKFSSSPKLELAECFKRILFCFLIGNGDMHLKNWSLMKDLKTGLVKLSPLYDCLNVRACFPQEQVELILPMAGKTRDFYREDFERFALETMDLQPIFVSKIFRDLSHWLGIITEFCQRSSLTSGMKQRYMTIVQERYSRLSG